MRINSHILSIPPYLSTSWENIASLHVTRDAEPLLIATLLNGNSVEIPHLERSVLDAIFSCHEAFLEQEQSTKQSAFPPSNVTSVQLPTEHIMAFEIPFKANFNLEAFSTVMQHNPEQADGPELPKDLICKIANLSKTIGIDDPNALPQPEPHCNCTHCQIARAIRSGFDAQEAPDEEIVTDEDLTFRSWDIAKTSENLYSVSNPLNAQDTYSVFLGNPVGCTCGEKHCEHIQAVLKS